MVQLYFYCYATLSQGVEGLDVDTTFIVNGVIDSDYNGSYAVQEVLSCQF